MNTEEELKEKLFQVMKKHHQVTSEQSSLEKRLSQLRHDKHQIDAERISIEHALSTYFRKLNEDDHSR